MVYTASEINELEEIARELRVDTLKMIHRRGSGHPGGTLSCIEILTSLLFKKINNDPSLADCSERDRFILSKGHASAALYVALAKLGFFPLSDLKRWGNLDCHLQGHPDRLKTPGVDMTTGLLGHGVAIGAGLALAARLGGWGYRTYVLLGDGECQAGLVWEGANLAAKYKLSNLTVVIDYNNVQLDGPIDEIMPLEPFAEKWEAFNWSTLVINGHNFRQLLEAFDEAEEIHHCPTVIIARTTKGKGVSFMENKSIWHGLVPDKSQLKVALDDLGE